MTWVKANSTLVLIPSMYRRTSPWSHRLQLSGHRCLRETFLHMHNFQMCDDSRSPAISDTHLAFVLLGTFGGSSQWEGRETQCNIRTMGWPVWLRAKRPWAWSICPLLCARTARSHHRVDGSFPRRGVERGNVRRWGCCSARYYHCRQPDSICRLWIITMCCQDSYA